MEYEIRTPNGYVFASQRDTGVEWKMRSGDGKRYAAPSLAVQDLERLRNRGYVCEIRPIE